MLSAFNGFLALLVIATLAALSWVQLKSARKSATLKRYADELSEEMARQGRPPEPHQPVTSYCLKVTLADPLAVAKRESKVAGSISALAPHVITREVYKQIKRETETIMLDRDIQADVRIDYQG